MNSIEIKPFSRKWHSSYIDLFRNTFLLDPWKEYWSRERAEKALDKTIVKNGFTGLVLLVDNIPAGFITGYSLYPFKRSFYMDQLFIDTNLQNMGLGRKILNEFLEQLKGKKIKKVFLKTHRGSPADSFYRKAGFQAFVSFGKSTFFMY